MASYHYIARTPAGAEVHGDLQADNEPAVLRALDERQLFPISVRRRRAPAARAQAVRLRDLAVAYGQLGDLLVAGVPLMRALGTVVRATPRRPLAEALAAVREDVGEGRALADALAARPAAFPALHAAMVRAGERGGFLEDVLANLADYLDRADELRSKVRGAMIYPAVLTAIGALALTVVLVWLVPKFRTVFGDTPLPAPTRALFAVSGALVAYWPLAAGGAVLAVSAAAAALRSGAGRRRWDRLKLKVPLVGPLLRTVAITRFCRILGTMLHNGVPILQALQISRDAAGSPLLAENIQRATESVRAGEKLAEPLARGGLFPPDVVEMISVAEEANQLEKVLVQIADTVERRTNRQVDAAVRLVEPLILVVLAAVIGLVAMGLMYPIFTMSRTLRP
jgi:general secretion pathway protein F/type IV pilus assembly protein PilC